jgi:hypothetical protein
MDLDSPGQINRATLWSVRLRLYLSDKHDKRLPRNKRIGQGHRKQPISKGRGADDPIPQGQAGIDKTLAKQVRAIAESSTAIEDLSDQANNLWRSSMAAHISRPKSRYKVQKNWPRAELAQATAAGRRPATHVKNQCNE